MSAHARLHRSMLRIAITNDSIISNNIFFDYLYLVVTHGVHPCLQTCVVDDRDEHDAKCISTYGQTE